MTFKDNTAGGRIAEPPGTGPGGSRMTKDEGRPVWWIGGRTITCLPEVGMFA